MDGREDIFYERTVSSQRQEDISLTSERQISCATITRHDVLVAQPLVRPKRTGVRKRRQENRENIRNFNCRQTCGRIMEQQLEPSETCSSCLRRHRGIRSPSPSSTG